jgi:hypothetical protein
MYEYKYAPMGSYYSLLSIHYSLLSSYVEV